MCSLRCASSGMLLLLEIAAFLSLLPSATVRCDNNVELTVQAPSVMVAVLIRNKEHTLPYFFTYLEELDYPKDRLSLW